MLDAFAKILFQHCRLDRGLPVLVGVSGGPDSLCLMHLFWRMGFKLVVAHYDHGLRQESQAEAAVVGQAAEAMGLPFTHEAGDVRSQAAAQRLSLEEAARAARYRFLFSQAARFAAQAVAVGHSADDQVETVLMHLLRGAGLSGLKGMAYRSLPTLWSERIPLVRPLLPFWREEILRYVQEQGLHPVQDASNLDPAFYRNRLRHELLPELQRYNPQVKRLLWRTAEILREEEAVLEAAEEAAWKACEAQVGAGSVSFELGQVLAQPTGLQRRILRRGIGCLRPGLRDISFETIERGLEFLRSPARSGSCDLAGGLRLLIEESRLWISDWEAELPDGHWPAALQDRDLHLSVPGILLLNAGWALQATLLPEAARGRDQAHNNLDSFQAWLDLDHLQVPLRVRTRRAGDRFRPLGLDGHSTKLSDLMINEKLPSRARAAWPLVLSGEEIAWVPGYGLAHPFRLTLSTARVLHLQLHKHG